MSDDPEYERLMANYLRALMAYREARTAYVQSPHLLMTDGTPAANAWHAAGAKLSTAVFALTAAYPNALREFNHE